MCIVVELVVIAVDVYLHARVRSVALLLASVRGQLPFTVGESSVLFCQSVFCFLCFKFAFSRM